MSTAAYRGIRSYNTGSLMELYLLRHGIAEDAHPGGTDAERQLTDEGCEKTAAAMKLARRTGVRHSTPRSKG